MDLSGRYRLADAAVHVRRQESHGLLPRGVIAKHDMAVRIDEPRSDGCPADVDHALGAREVARGADGRDAPVLNQQGVVLVHRSLQGPGDQGPDAHERGGRRLGHLAQTVPDRDGARRQAAETSVGPSAVSHRNGDDDLVGGGRITRIKRRRVVVIPHVEGVLVR